MHSKTYSPYLLLLLWSLPIVLVQVLFSQSLMAHDEGYYAIQAKYMFQTGDWITPQWGWGPNFDRTVGIQWLIGLGYKVFGIHEIAVRLPSLLAYLGTVLLTFRIGALTLGSRIGFLAALIFSVVPIAVQYAGLGTQDMVLLMIELLAAWSLLEAQVNQKRSLLLLTGAAFGWGFLVKGFMMIPATIAFLPALWFGAINPSSEKKRLNLNFLAIFWLALGGAIGLTPVIGWLWAATQQYGWGPIQMLVGKIFFLNDQEFHSAGPLYYFWNIPANAFPWGVIGPLGLALCFFNSFYKKTIEPYKWLVLGFPILLFIELNLFRTKTPYYPIQLLPWISIWSAVLLNHCTDFYRKDWRSQLLGQISQGVGVLGFIVLCTGILLLSGVLNIQGDVIPGIGAVLSVLGIAWVMLPILWKKRSQFESRDQFIDRWLISLCLGPALAVTLMGWTGLWGDYAVSLKTGLKPAPVRQVLSKQTVHFVSPPTGLDSDAQKDYILLTFHTPKLGKHITSIAQLPPNSYAWVSPTIKTDDRALATVRGWRLIKH